MIGVIVVGTEEIRSIPGNQTTLDLRDLTVGVSYGVSVTALVGENEGDPVTVYIKPGEMNSDFEIHIIIMLKLSYSRSKHSYFHSKMSDFLQKKIYFVVHIYIMYSKISSLHLTLPLLSSAQPTKFSLAHSF